MAMLDFGFCVQDVTGVLPCCISIVGLAVENVLSWFIRLKMNPKPIGRLDALTLFANG
jgi:hypothetical protein